jgi:hypothetical protein
MGSRPFVAFLAPKGGAEVGIENTRPASLVIGVGAVASLAPSALSFLLARALDLLAGGYALAGKFPARDLAILCELACRFAGARPPSMGLPDNRADAYLTALERIVPAPTKERAIFLGAGASEELALLDPRAFAAALRRTASRVALLYTGEPHGALSALARLDRRFEGADPRVIDRAQALAIPDLRDVAQFALSDEFLELRAEMGV